jgi:hypothetical protein
LNGEPVAAMIRWRQGECEGVGEVRTDQKSVLQGIPAGPVDVTVREAVHHGEQTTHLTLAAGESLKHEFAFINDGRHVQGTVYDQKGRVVAGVRVVLVEAADRQDVLSVEGKTNDDGRFDLEMPGKGRLGLLRLVDDRYAELVVEVGTGEMDAVLTALPKDS